MKTAGSKPEPVGVSGDAYPTASVPSWRAVIAVVIPDRNDPAGTQISINTYTIGNGRILGYHF